MKETIKLHHFCGCSGSDLGIIGFYFLDKNYSALNFDVITH
jgi:hypothetical protein